MATEERWRKAQGFEKGYWQRSAARVKSGQRPALTHFKWRSENMMSMVNKAFPGRAMSFSQARVLEVGSGPVGTCAYLDAAERFAVDPLCDFYSTLPELIVNRNPNVVYRCSKGEALEFETSSMDLVITENVIDHVQNVDDVMKEIHRVMKPGAVLFLTVNLHPAWGMFLHEIIAALRIDPGHPHTFTVSKIKRFLEGHQFEIKYCEWEDYGECRRKDFHQPSLKEKIKAVTGLSEYLFSSVSVRV
jgi:SAM-dependent methyltransferase